MTRSLLRIAVILGLSTAAAIGQSRLRDIAWFPPRETFDEKQAFKAWIRAEALIDLPRFQQMIDGGAIVIDARAKSDYETAHLDLGPNAMIPTLNIEPEHVDQNLDRLMTVQGMQTVIYCNSATCDLAEELLIELVARGFVREDFKIYRDGWDGIRAAHMPSKVGADTWTGLEMPDMSSDAAEAAQPDEGGDSVAGEEQP